MSWLIREIYAVAVQQHVAQSSLTIVAFGVNGHYITPYPTSARFPLETLGPPG